MKTKTLLLTLSAVCAAGQNAPPEAQQRIAAIRQSIAQNRELLKHYSWTETTEVSLKGEVRRREQHECRYGPDGKIQKTPVGEPGEAQGHKRGIRGRMAGKKADELKDYMDRMGSLVRRYVPPDPEAMRAAVKAGKASLDRESGDLVFRDYAKPGDKVTLSFDPAARKLRAYNVATYLYDQQDAVNLSARFSSLPDGVNFLEESLLDATAKQIQIKTTNFGHKKSGQ